MTLDFDLLPPFQRRIMAAATQLARQEDREVYLVGGAVRDLLLGQTTRDIDFTVPDDSESFADSLARLLGGGVIAFPAFRTHKIEPPGEPPIDVTTARSEVYEVPGALPIVSEGTLRQDMERRDFSINALAFRLHDGVLIDLLGGVDDLRAGVLRVLHDQSFIDDPTRMIRGVRLASRLALTLDAHTRALLGEAVGSGTLRTISAHRLWREILLGFEEEHPIAALRSLSEAGLLPFAVQPLHQFDQLVEELAAANPHDRDLIVAGYLVASPDIAGSFHGCEWGERRKRQLQRIVESIATAPAGLAELASPREQYAFLHRLPIDAIRILSVTAPEQQALFHRYLHAAQTPISFRDCLGSIPPGPHIRRALDETREALFEGRITPEAAQTFASAAAIRYFSEREGA